MLAVIAGAVLPGVVIDRTRTELKSRLDVPSAPLPAKQRARLQKRLDQIEEAARLGRHR